MREEVFQNTFSTGIDPEIEEPSESAGMPDEQGEADESEHGDEQITEPTEQEEVIQTEEQSNDGFTQSSVEDTNDDEVQIPTKKDTSLKEFHNGEVLYAQDLNTMNRWIENSDDRINIVVARPKILHFQIADNQSFIELYTTSSSNPKQIKDNDVAYVRHIYTKTGNYIIGQNQQTDIPQEEIDSVEYETYCCASAIYSSATSLWTFYWEEVVTGGGGGGSADLITSISASPSNSIYLVGTTVALTATLSKGASVSLDPNGGTSSEVDVTSDVAGVKTYTFQAKKGSLTSSKSKILQWGKYVYYAVSQDSDLTDITPSTSDLQTSNSVDNRHIDIPFSESGMYVYFKTPFIDVTPVFYINGALAGGFEEVPSTVSGYKLYRTNQAQTASIILTITE